MLSEHFTQTSWGQLAQLAPSQTSGLTSILIPGPDVICGWDHNESNEGRQEIEERIAVVIILELLPGHFVAAPGSPFFSAAALPPSSPMRAT